MSDLLRPREWRSRELYNVVFQPYQYELELRIPSSRTGYTRTFLFHAQKRDFGERDRLVLELLRPHLERVVDRFGRRATPEADLPLTRREREILEWVERGKTNAEIAEILWLSPSTVQAPRERLRQARRAYTDGRRRAAARPPVGATGRPSYTR